MCAYCIYVFLLFFDLTLYCHIPDLLNPVLPCYLFNPVMPRCLYFNPVVPVLRRKAYDKTILDKEQPLLIHRPKRRDKLQKEVSGFFVWLDL